MRLAVLMFHALYRGEEEVGELAAEERPYAVSQSAFTEILDLIGDRCGFPPTGTTGATPGPEMRDEADEQRVLITFDDGHQSNYRYALPLLAARNIQATFFVTTDFIGARPGYCTWSELTEMADAGMQVQSHGVTHRFLDDLKEDEVRRELLESKRIIEDHTGREVGSISFPGGRHGRRELRLASDVGYRHCYSSRFGLHRRVSEIPFLVRRIAVRRGMSAKQTAAMAMGEPWPSLQRHAAETIKSAARRILGNRAYEAVYRKWAR